MTMHDNAEERLQRTQRLLESIRLAQSQFIAEADPRQVFAGLLDVLLDITGSEYGFIGEVLLGDDGKPHLQTHAITNIAWTDELRAAYERQAPGLRFDNLRNLFGHALTTGEPVIALDPATDPRRGGLPEGHPPLRAFLGLPFWHGGATIGMAGIANRPGGYDQELLEFLTPFSSTCANLIQALRNDRRRRAAEQTLRESEERWRTVVENVPDFIVRINRAGAITFINRLQPGFESRLVVGTSALAYVAPDYQAAFRDALQRVFDRGEPMALEMVGRGAPDEWRWYIDRLAPIREAGEIVAALLVATDITERKVAEERTLASLREKEALLVEVHHRVKNNLQIVTSLLNLQATRLSDPAVVAVFTQTRDRVRSMALLHEMLYQADSLADLDLPRYVDQLCHHLLRSFGADVRRILLHTDVREKNLELDQAIPCGLIINELVSNALKYAFPDDRTGSIRVEFCRDEAAYVLRVADDGIGLPPELDWRSGASLGLRLVCDLARQLRGHVQIHRNPGTFVQINFDA